jgi:hypothetical protein
MAYKTPEQGQGRTPGRQGEEMSDKDMGSISGGALTQEQLLTQFHKILDSSKTVEDARKHLDNLEQKLPR